MSRNYNQVTDAELDEVLGESSTNNNRMFNTNFIGDIASAIPQVTAQFNRGFQENQLAIEQERTRQAEASFFGRSSMGGNNNNPRTGYIIGGIVLIVVAVLIFKGK